MFDSALISTSAGSSYAAVCVPTAPAAAGVPARLDAEMVGGWIAALADGPSDLEDAARVDLIRALEELKSAASARQARVSIELDRSQRALQRAAGVPAERLGIGVAAQIALARRESPHRGGQYLGLARALVAEMPCTLAALEAGVLSEWRATLLVRESGCLSREDRAALDREVAGDLSALDGVGDRALVARAKAVAQRLDVASVVARARRAESERCVTLRPAPDTMAYLTALLPVAQGVGVYAALTRAADSARAAGDPRGRGQLMADTLVARIAAGGGIADGVVNGDGVPDPAAVRLEVQLVMTDRTLLAGGDDSASIPGYGTVPGPWARNLVLRSLERRPETPQGLEGRAPIAAADRPRRRHEPPGALPPGPPVPEPPGALPPGPPVVEAPGALPSGPPGPEPPGLVPPGPPVAEPPGALPPRALPAGTPGPDRPRASRPERARVWVRRLFTAPTTGQLVAMDSRARLAPDGLADLIRARDAACRTPWCDAPIRQIDHVTPHADEGATSADNLQGLCEICNYAKEAPGWHETTMPAAGAPRVPGEVGGGEAVESPGAQHPREAATPSRATEIVRRPAVAAGAAGVRGPAGPHDPAALVPDVLITTPTGHRYVSRAPAMPGTDRTAPAGRPTVTSVEQPTVTSAERPTVASPEQPTVAPLESVPAAAA